MNSSYKMLLPAFKLGVLHYPQIKGSIFRILRNTVVTRVEPIKVSTFTAKITSRVGKSEVTIATITLKVHIPQIRSDNEVNQNYSRNSPPHRYGTAPKEGSPKRTLHN
jgi:hypothetical protein